MKPIVAIFSTCSEIGFEELRRTVAAIQTQVSRDLRPHWAVDATLLAVPNQASVPAGAWVVELKNDIGQDLYGYHSVTAAGVPFAVLRYQSNWTRTLSHETCEMLVDPYADRLMNGEYFNQTPDGDINNDVQYLVEVADPSQNFGYEIDGVRVSDFFLPSYYDLYKTPNKRYSFTGAITEPLSLAVGGYVSFKDRYGAWFQAFRTSNGITIKKLATGEILTTSEKDRTFNGILLAAAVLFVAIVGFKILKKIF